MEELSNALEENKSESDGSDESYVPANALRDAIAEGQEEGERTKSDGTVEFPSAVALLGMLEQKSVCVCVCERICV